MMNFQSEEDTGKDEDKSKYWFTRDKMDKILKVHDYLNHYQKLEKCCLLIYFKSSRRFKHKELQVLEIAVYM